MSEKILKILVVEDDSTDREIIKRAIKASGMRHELVFAEDHENGLAATNGKEYDCIFLDYNLPGGTGLELLKTIRASGNTSPIIIVTSLGDEKLAVEAIKLGADDYMPKDLLSGKEIRNSVRHMINSRENLKRQQELEKQLHETQNRLSTVVSNAPIILFSLNKKAEFILFEGKGLFSLGIDKDTIINHSLTEYNDLPIRIEDYQRSMKGEEHTDIIEWRMKFFEIFYSPIFDEHRNITGVLGIASDITSHKQAEKELKFAKHLAEETALIKEQFLANMSHEIRTPMNGIVGLTNILLNTPLTSEQLKYMQAIKTSSDNLMVIINDILDFSKIEAGKMKFESVPFIIDEVAGHTIELFQSKADEKSISLILEKDNNIPCYLCGDPTRLTQVLNNLVSNAIKFTQKGEVRLSLKLNSITGEKAVITFEIKDTGIGIPEKSLPTIFESFTQASSDTTRKFGGTGLGLSIVKNIIELQQGEIQVKSKQGIGTVFSFSIPFVLNSAEVKVTQKIKTNNLNTSHLKILIAEDNYVNQMVVKRVFEEWKTNVDIAENGALALEKLRNSDYDLVLMDIQMPEMDGYTAVSKIRSEFPEPKKSIPIIALTAHASPTERQKCLDANMDEYVSKPFDPEELKSKILLLTKSVIPSLNDARIEKTVSESVFVNPTPVQNETMNSAQPLPAENQFKNITDPVNPNKLNLSFLKKIAEGNQAFIIEMIEMFLNKTPEALEQMNDCFQKQNWEELKKIAHRIKPSFAYVGMQDLQSTLATIEKCSDTQEDRKVVSDLLKKVEIASNHAFELLRVELSTLK
jgi:PAS domain S-box-containing protein